MESIKIDIDKVYMPAKKRKELTDEKIEQMAEILIEEGQRTPIQVRQGEGRYVLIEGGVRLEALKLLGETQIDAILVQARKH